MYVGETQANKCKILANEYEVFATRILSKEFSLFYDSSFDLLIKLYNIYIYSTTIQLLMP